MTTFPVHVYKSPGIYPARGGKTYNLESVANEEELEAMQDKGWHLSRADALNPPKVEQKATEPDDEGAPTRAELEQKATELGLKFDGRTSDGKLGKMIAEALG